MVHGPNASYLLFYIIGPHTLLFLIACLRARFCRWVEMSYIDIIPYLISCLGSNFAWFLLILSIDLKIALRSFVYTVDDLHVSVTG